MVVGFVGVERIVGFMVVHMVVDAGGLTKSAYSLKIGSLQLRIFWFGFGLRVRGVTCPR